MTSAQSRIAETLETFYGAADRSSEGAMAGHAYKRSVDDLDTTFSRELVCLFVDLTRLSHSGLGTRMYPFGQPYPNLWERCVPIILLSMSI
jgi:hypothetical protein